MDVSMNATTATTLPIGVYQSSISNDGPRSATKTSAVQLATKNSVSAIAANLNANLTLLTV